MSDTFYTVDKDRLDDIANAIRLKRDITDSMTLEDMPMQIGLIGGKNYDYEIYSGEVENLNDSTIIIPLNIDLEEIALFYIYYDGDWDSTDSVHLEIFLAQIKTQIQKNGYSIGTFIRQSGGVIRSNITKFLTKQNDEIIFTPNSSSYKFNDGNYKYIILV